MKTPWRCWLFGHDYWPVRYPVVEAGGIVTTALCRCRRCDDAAEVSMILTDQLMKRAQDRGLTP